MTINGSTDQKAQTAAEIIGKFHGMSNSLWFMLFHGWKSAIQKSKNPKTGGSINLGIGYTFFYVIYRCF